MYYTDILQIRFRIPVRILLELLIMNKNRIMIQKLYIHWVNNKTIKSIQTMLQEQIDR